MCATSRISTAVVLAVCGAAGALGGVIPTDQGKHVPFITAKTGEHSAAFHPKDVFAKPLLPSDEPATTSNPWIHTALIHGQFITFYDPQPFVTVTDSASHQETYSITTRTVFDGVPVKLNPRSSNNKREIPMTEGPVNDLPELLNYEATTYSVDVPVHTYVEPANGATPASTYILPARVVKVYEDPASSYGVTPAPTAVQNLNGRDSPDVSIPLSILGVFEPLLHALLSLPASPCGTGIGADSNTPRAEEWSINNNQPHPTVTSMVGHCEEGVCTTVPFLFDTRLPVKLAAGTPEPVWVTTIQKSLPLETLALPTGTSTPSPIEEIAAHQETETGAETAPAVVVTTTHHTHTRHTAGHHAHSTPNINDENSTVNPLVVVTEIITVYASAPVPPPYADATSHAAGNDSMGGDRPQSSSIPGHTYITFSNPLNPTQLFTIGIGPAKSSHPAASRNTTLPATTTSSSEHTVSTTSTGDVWNSSDAPPTQTAALSSSPHVVGLEGSIHIIGMTIGMAFTAAAAAYFL